MLPSRFKNLIRILLVQDFLWLQLTKLFAPADVDHVGLDQLPDLGDRVSRNYGLLPEQGRREEVERAAAATSVRFLACLRQHH